MIDVILACADLMTASKLDDPSLRVRRCGTHERVTAAVAELPDAVIVIDLGGFPTLPQSLRDAGLRARIVAFAPHVRVELIDAARPWCDLVLPRGAIVKRFSAAVLGAQNSDG